MRDARVDDFPIGIYTVTIDTHRHGKFRRDAGSPLQRVALPGCCPQTTGQRPTLPREPQHYFSWLLFFRSKLQNHHSRAKVHLQ